MTAAKSSAVATEPAPDLCTADEAARAGANRPPRLLSLVRAAGEVEERLEASMLELGLSMGKFSLLGRLAVAKDPLPLSQLADCVGCVRSNVTQLVDRLEADGLVTRVSHPTDRRSIRAALTPAGRERYRQAARAVDRTERELVAQWQEADRAAFARVVCLLAQCSRPEPQ
jgi:DNA-binding MarR family transcriptional regulator